MIERRYDTVETNTHHSPTRQEDLLYCPVCEEAFASVTRCPDGCGTDLVTREDARAVGAALDGLLGEGETT